MQLLKLWGQSEFRCLSRISSKLKQFSLRPIVGKSLRKLYYVAACPLSEEIHLLVLSHIAVQKLARFGFGNKEVLGLTRQCLASLYVQLIVLFFIQNRQKAKCPFYANSLTYRSSDSGVRER